MVKNIKGIVIELDGDATGLTKALKKVDNETKNVQQELKQVDNLLKLDGTNVDLLSQKQKLLGDAIDGTSKRLGALKQAQTEVERQFQNGEIGEEAYRKFSREIIATEGKLKAFQAQADAVKVKIDAQTDTSSLDKMTKKLEEVGDKAKEVGNKMKDVGSEMSTKLTAPLAAFGTGALAAAGQFDNAAGQIQAALGVTADEAEALENKATSVWKTGFGESLEEVSSGLIRVKQNMKEIDGSEIEGITKNALALAKTFDSDVNEVTRAANNLMVNFGITSGEAFDLLAYGAQNGLNFSNELFDNVAEYSGLFSTLGFESKEYFNALIKGSQEGIYNLDYLNDVVKEFGIRIKDGSKSTTEAIAYLFANDGIDDFVESLKTAGSSSEAYQALMAKVGKETADMWTADLKKTGKASEDATTFIQMTMGSYDEFMQGMTDGSIKGSDAMQMIIEKIQALDDPTTRAQMGVSLFGTKWEDLEETAMFSLTNIGGEIQNLEGSMESVSGSLEDTFGQRLNNLTRSAAQSLEPVGQILLDFAEKILPKVIAVVEGLAKWFSNLSPVMQGVTVAIGIITAAIGPLLIAAGMIMTAIGQLTPLFIKLIPIVKAAGTAILGMSGPIAIAIAAVTAFIAIGIALYKNWDEVTAFLTDCWKSIASTATTLFSNLVSFFSKIWSSIASVTTTVWTSTKNSLSTILSGIKATFDNVVSSISANLQKYWSNMSSGTIKVFDGIKQYFTSLWSLIKNIFVGALLVLLQLLTGKWGEAKKSTEQIWVNIKDSMKGILEGIQKIFSGSLSVIVGYVKTSWELALSTTKTIFSNLQNLISSTWKNVQSATTSTISNIVSTVTSKFTDIVNSVRTKMGETLSTIKEIWGNVQSFFSGIDLYSIGRDIISGLIRGIKNMTSQAIEAVTGVVDGVINKAKNLLGIKSPSRVFMEIGHDTNAGFIEGIKENNNKLQKTVGNVYGSLASSAQKSAEVSTSNIKNTTSTIDNSKYMQPQIHITVQGGNMSPSEIARKALQTQRQLAMEWGV